MNILFVSQSYPNELMPLFEKKSKVALDYAANNLGRAIIKGFKDNGYDINVLNYSPNGSFPFYYRNLIVEGYESIDGKYDSPSYFNLIYLKRFFYTHKIRSRINKWCANCKGPKVILFYSYTFLPIISQLKRKYKDLKICVLAADLPEYMATSTDLIAKIHRFIGGDKPASGAFYEDVNGYILLSEAMRDRLPMKDKPWILIEGIYNSEIEVASSVKEPYSVILYTGDLSQKYGILDLVKAFHQIEDESLRLWICGAGDSVKIIKDYSEIDRRIEYKGRLPRQEILCLQKMATLLVNPRKSDGEYTKYSFPSKTMEYMASGTPTLMAHLPCIPTEYDTHLYFIKEETVPGLASSIISILRRPKEELYEKGYKAACFIRQNKTPLPQVKKIIEFLEVL